MKLFLIRLGLFLITIFFVGGCVTPQQPRSTFPTVPTTTGNAENLIRETNEPSDVFYPRVSPDGRHLYYNTVENTVRRTIVDNQLTAVNNKIKIVRKEIGKPVTNPLKDNAADPAIMPNGNILFTYVLPSKPVIAYTSPQGVGINYISQGELGDNDSQPAISSDGGKIVFSTLIGRVRMICTMDSKGGNFTVLTEGFKPAFIPGVKDKIMYNQVVSKHVQVFTLDLQTGQKSQLTTGEYHNMDAAFSFDGQHVAFVSNREDPLKIKCHVYVMRVDGTDLKQITQGETNEATVTWGPDGTLYFACNAGNKYNIWKVKPKL